MKTEEYMQPIWSGNIVYEESIMYIQGQDGVVSAAPLLYIPEKILEVRSSDQKVTYEEGKDYILNGDICFGRRNREFRAGGTRNFIPHTERKSPLPVWQKRDGIFVMTAGTSMQPTRYASPIHIRIGGGGRYRKDSYIGCQVFRENGSRRNR